MSLNLLRRVSIYLSIHLHSSRNTFPQILFIYTFLVPTLYPKVNKNPKNYKNPRHSSLLEPANRQQTASPKSTGKKSKEETPKRGIPRRHKPVLQ
ncbi:hypothetical protein GYMLUDRAFT_586873 [Collybiopsis luxurians FD-317 M1]|uniref:Uncharacterized protein n=1 Tax=Collybiopsis luxurians FD-317 M1 TaxID=944289 RepID=A0A0D0CXR1_9AGAR|nr:hypothetical protein GYMLUDRAFT_586873 [Collybiopsis luxurians FD-317 M1]